MTQQTQTGLPAEQSAAGLTAEQSAAGLTVEHSTAGLTVVHSTAHQPRATSDGLQVVIRPGMVYTVEADSPSAARVGRHRRPAPVKAAGPRRARDLLATLAGVVLIAAGIAVIAWTMAHQ